MNSHGVVALWSIRILLALIASNCLAGDSPRPHDIYRCSDGGIHSYSVLDMANHDYNDFWRPLTTDELGDNPSEVAKMLTEFLVDSDESRIREWALENLAGFNWFKDFSEHEDVFRECDEKHDFACSDVFARNKLVFGERPWKVGFLNAVFEQRSRPSFENETLVQYDGLMVDMGLGEGCRFVADLGLMELEVACWESLTHLSETISLGKVEPIEQRFGVSRGLVGSSTGSTHPVTVMTRRLNEMESQEIVDRVLDDEALGFRGFLGKVLRYLCTEGHTECNPECQRHGRICDRTFLPQLMEPLGKAYRWFLENPPYDRINDLEDYQRLDNKVKFFLRGGCSGPNIERFAFSNDAERREVLDRAGEEIRNHLVTIGYVKE